MQGRYGSLELLSIEEVERPAPGDNEVLVLVHAVAVTLSDTMMRKGQPLAVRLFSGLLRPKQPTLGAEFAGEVVVAGKDVERFVVGDRVFGSTGDDGGCYADYVCISEDSFVASMPSNMTYEEGAPVCGVLAAWNFLQNKAKVQSGQRILISGASGSIGTAAVQLAHHFGAEVTGVCSTANLGLVESLGADRVIDYTREDFTKGVEKYDIIFDCENKSSFSRCKKVLTPDGQYLKTYPGPAIVLQMLWTSRIGRKKAVISATGLLPVSKRLALLAELKQVIENEDLRPVVDKCFALDEIADAYRHAERGHKRGTVVVSVDQANTMMGDVV